jgi:hypothetical protein
MVNVCSYQRIEYIEIDVVPLRYTQSQLEISMGMMDHGDRVLITADPAYRDRYCATEIYSVPIRCLKGVAAKSRSYQPPSQIFHNIKSREKSQISSHLNPSSQWSCSNTVIISATSSNFPNTSPERCSVREHSTVSDDRQQTFPYQPARQTTTAQFQRDETSENAKSRRTEGQNYAHTSQLIKSSKPRSPVRCRQKPSNLNTAKEFSKITYISTIEPHDTSLSSHTL